MHTKTDTLRWDRMEGYPGERNVDGRGGRGGPGGGDTAKQSTREKQRGEVRPGAVTLLVLEHLHSGQVSRNYVNYFTTQLRAGREMEIQSRFWWRRTCVVLHLSSHSFCSDSILLFWNDVWGDSVQEEKCSVCFGLLSSNNTAQFYNLLQVKFENCLIACKSCPLLFLNEHLPVKHWHKTQTLHGKKKKSGHGVQVLSSKANRIITILTAKWYVVNDGWFSCCPDNSSHLIMLCSLIV